MRDPPKGVFSYIEKQSVGFPVSKREENKKEKIVGGNVKGGVGEVRGGSNPWASTEAPTSQTYFDFKKAEIENNTITLNDTFQITEIKK